MKRTTRDTVTAVIVIETEAADNVTIKNILGEFEVGVFERALVALPGGEAAIEPALTLDTAELAAGLRMLADRIHRASEAEVEEWGVYEYATGIFWKTDPATKEGAEAAIGELGEDGSHEVVRASEAERFAKAYIGGRQRDRKGRGE